MVEVVIASAVRTPIGAYGGIFKEVSAVELGRVAAVGAIERAGIKPGDIDEVILGNVLQAGIGQNTARQVSRAAGVPDEVPAFTINKVCGSGLKTVWLAAQSIMCGDNEVVLCGGTESMSMAPYLIPAGRWGVRMGDSKIIDYMVNDGLTDAFHHYHMGITAENVVEKYGFTREEVDQLALESQNKAEAAQKSNRFKEEIVPVIVPQKKGEPKVFDQDEYPKHGTTMETLTKLKPAFKKDGVVTAGNASGINDGAACLIVMSKKKADELGIKPIATIVTGAAAGVDPAIMGTGPIPTTQKALQKAGMKIEDIDLIEANEAFAAQALSVIKDLKFNRDIVNVNGGAIALGHPIGASGARILVTLLHEMEKRDAKTGLATLCIGGGQGQTLIVKR